MLLSKSKEVTEQPTGRIKVCVALPETDIDNDTSDWVCGWYIRWYIIEGICGGKTERTN